MSDKAIISYVPQIECKWRNFDENEKITHDKLNTFKFSSRSLFEVIDDKVDNVRLFFDFDEADTCEQVEAIIDFLDNLVDQCGKYALAGYTTNESMRDIIDVRYIPFDELDKQVKAVSGHNAKTFSCHAVFYQSRVNAKQLKAVMSNINDYDIPEGVKIDNSVYKFPRLFRHPYSDKVYKKGQTIKNAGTSPNKDSADKLVITCDGNETIDVNANWLFDLKESTTEQQQDQQTTEQPHDDNKPATTTTQETKMTPELFKLVYEGFKGFEIHGDGADVQNEISLYPLFSSLYKCQNDVIDTNLIKQALAFISANNTLTESAMDRWGEIKTRAANNKLQTPGPLFNYLKRFNPEYYNNKIKPLIEPETYEFNIRDKFLLRDIEQAGRDHKYQLNGDINKFDHNKLLNDLKRVLVVVDVGYDYYVLKVYNDFTKNNTICFLSQRDAERKFTNIYVGTKANKKGDEQVYVSIWDVYNAGFNKLMFKKKAIRFFSENKDVFSVFQGYDFVKTDKVDNDLIAPFLEHVKTVWCSNDAYLFNYVNTWFATILQKPNVKTEICLVVKGKEGSGKNTVTNVWCDLLGCYANRNITNVDEIVGRFNKTLENKKLIVLNELASVENNMQMNPEALKSVISDDFVQINEKYVNSRQSENVANFIVVTNNLNPVRITSNDRRYCVIKTADSVIRNFKYFERLHKLVKREDFKQSLFNYYMNYDITTLNILDIPETEARTIMKDINRSAHELFVREYAKRFNEGFRVIECYAYYKQFCKDRGYTYPLAERSFWPAISEFTERKRRCVGGSKPYYYFLKDSYKHWVDEQNEEEEYEEYEEQQEQPEQKQEEQQDDDDEPFDPTTALNKLLGLI